MRGENQIPTVQVAETASAVAFQEAGEAEEAIKNDEYYRANYGISLAEARQTVRYSDKEANLGDVLEHEQCPLGGWVKQANLEGGREAVEQKFSLFGQMATEFNVALGDEAENQKKN